MSLIYHCPYFINPVHYPNVDLKETVIQTCTAVLAMEVIVGRLCLLLGLRTMKYIYLRFSTNEKSKCALMNYASIDNYYFPQEDASFKIHVPFCLC